MILDIIENYPSVKFIDTGNANMNKCMLSITIAMGFHKHKEEHSYQLNLIDLKTHLENKFKNNF